LPDAARQFLVVDDVEEAAPAIFVLDRADIEADNAANRDPDAIPERIDQGFE
jgi:hypothetical protein